MWLKKNSVRTNIKQYHQHKGVSGSRDHIIYVDVEKGQTKNDALKHTLTDI